MALLGAFRLANPTTWDASTKAANDNVSGLVWTGGTSGAVGFVKSFFSTSAGKYYWEVIPTGTVAAIGIGICTTATTNSGNFDSGHFAGGFTFLETGSKTNNAVNTAYGSAYVSGNVIGIALDLTNGKLFFSINNVWQNSGDPVAGTGAAFTGLSGTFAAVVGHQSFAAPIATANFGATPFAGTVPSGYTPGFGT